MKKAPISCLALAALSFLASAPAVAGFGEEDVVGLVDKTAADIAADAAGTFELIVNGEHPYRNKDDNAHYVFVYDTEVVIVAHPKRTLVGKSYRGKSDVRGKNFRDDIVAGALAEGTGWVTYSYAKPGDKGIHKKKTYFKLCTGSDGKNYVVCSGMYAE